MRPLNLIFLFLLLPMCMMAQSTRRSRPMIYSASSDWQKVTLKAAGSRSPRPPSTSSTTSVDTPAAVEPSTRQPGMVESTAEVVPQASRISSSASISTGYRPAFTGDFATNRNGWKAGNKGDYQYQIGLGRYNIRKRNLNTKQVAFSYVSLPPDINLNRADTFTIKVDVLADSGRIPTGGIVFGVKDSLNYSAFTLNSQGQISITRVENGEISSDYMAGDFFSPGVPVDKNRNRLSIRRRRAALYFYINEHEVRSSPYPFKILSGNGIGMTTSAYWTSFQKLTVTLGP